MGDLTKNISRHEVACRCDNKFGTCNAEAMDFETIAIVQDACDHFAKKLDVDKVVLLISSGNRCPAYNDTPVKDGGVGGSKGSYHKLAMAMDHRIKGVSIKDLYDYYNTKYPNRLGLGYYPPRGKYKGFVHLDPRNYKARW
ncbi:endolysin [Vibrio phage K404]